MNNPNNITAGVNHGHVALFFYTTDQSSSTRNLYWSFGSGPDPAPFLGQSLHPTLEKKGFSADSPDDYAEFLKTGSREIYDRFVVFELERGTYQLMLNAADTRVMPIYWIWGPNCLTEASKLMDIASSYFGQWSTTTVLPNEAFNKIVTDFQTYPLLLNGLNNSNFTSTIVNHAISPR